MITTVTMNTAVDKLYLVPNVTPHQVTRVRQVTNTAGGKGLNVARVAAQAGEAVTATGIVGGHSGELLLSLLQGSGIHLALTKTAAETRSCINIRDDSGGSTEFLEPGAPVTAQDLAQFLEDYQTAIRHTQVVTISGSAPKGTPADFYSQLIHLAKEAGKQVLLDTSGSLLQESLAACPTMVKPNTDEIRQIFDVDLSSPEDLIHAAQRIHAGGIPIVAVSLGQEGVLVVCEEGIFKATPPTIQTVNTVGCGDSMVAGFAIGLARKMGMTDTIRFATALATANALTLETGSFQQADLDRLLPLVQIQRLGNPC